MRSDPAIVLPSLTPTFLLNSTCAELKRLAPGFDPPIAFLEALKAVYVTGLTSPLTGSQKDFHQQFEARLSRALWCVSMSVARPSRQSGPLVCLGRLPKEAHDSLSDMAHRALFFLPFSPAAHLYWALLDALVARGCQAVGQVPHPGAVMAWIDTAACRDLMTTPQSDEPASLGLPLFILPTAP